MKKDKIIFITILLIGIFIRVYKLYENPMGIHVDEAGMYVDANMIAKFGVDRHNQEFPIYFQNFGGGQSAMYTYITATLIKIFSSSYNLIRVPSVLFGILQIIFSYLIAREFMNKKYSLFLMAFISFCPYFIQASRIGLDCNLFLPFSTMSLYTFIKAIKSNKKSLFIISGIMYGLTLYTYAISYLIIPTFLPFSTIYLLINKKINIKDILLIMIPFIIIVLPLIDFILVNYNILSSNKFLIFSIEKLPNFRSSEISVKNIIENLFMIISLLSHDFLDYNSKRLFGTIYYTFVPFFILGFIQYTKKIFKHDNCSIENLIYLYFINNYFGLLFISEININKANSIYFVIMYIIIYYIYNKKSKLLDKLLIILLIINFIIFNFYYFKNIKLNEAFFDNKIYKEVEMNYKMGKKIEIIKTRVIEPEIYIKLGKINQIKNKKEIIYEDPNTN